MNDPKGEMIVTAMLDALRIPYTGTGTQNYGFSMDKDIIYAVCKDLGVPHPRSERFLEGQSLNHHLEYPVILKPCCTDGSFGITEKSVCYNKNELYAALKMVRETFHVHGPVLVQEYLPGKDINFGMIGNLGLRTILLPITEEDYSAVPKHFPRILGFESKWLPNSPYWLIKSVPTTLSPEKQQIIINYSLLMMNRLGYRDYCRFDWRLDASGDPRLLELNPNCGWCDDGHLAKMCMIDGIGYPGMLEAILDACVERVINDQKQQHENEFLSMDELLTQFGPRNPLEEKIPDLTTRKDTQDEKKEVSPLRSNTLSVCPISKGKLQLSLRVNNGTFCD